MCENQPSNLQIPPSGKACYKISLEVNYNSYLSLLSIRINFYRDFAQDFFKGGGVLKSPELVRWILFHDHKDKQLAEQFVKVYRCVRR